MYVAHEVHSGDVERVPVLAQSLRQGIDLLIVADVTRQHNVRIEVLRERFDAGAAAEWQITRRLALPLQLHLVHEGGQLFAAGLFIAAVHTMGLVTLTHTPNPMAFVSELLGRPANEKAMLIMPVGHPAADARVPDLARKPLDDIAVWR